MSALAGLLLVINESGAATDAARLAPVFLAIGIGNGLLIPALIGVSLTDVPPQKAGAAAGTLATSQQFAIATGIAVLSEIFFAALDTPPTEDSYLTAIQYVSLLDIALVVGALIVSFWLPRLRPETVVSNDPVRAAEPGPATD